MKFLKKFIFHKYYIFLGIRNKKQTNCIIGGIHIGARVECSRKWNWDKNLKNPGWGGRAASEGLDQEFGRRTDYWKG